MPILETNILGSKIEINYQKNEKDKLLHVIKKFQDRLAEFENIKGKFTDNKIIFLAALKAEDKIFELKQKIDIQKKIIDSSKKKHSQIDDKIREIINLKDQLSLSNEKNQKLEEQNKISLNEFEKLNQRLVILIKKIMNININEN